MRVITGTEGYVITYIITYFINFNKTKQLYIINLINLKGAYWHKRLYYKHLF